MPESAADIKGSARTRTELKNVCARPDDFAEVAMILDNQLRLMTPVDDERDSETETVADRYQLTHDYLVPSIRSWLHREQRSTPGGRARIELREFAADWNQRPGP